MVLLPDSTGVGGEQVTLHRITSESGSVADRAATGADGRFRFVLPREATEEAVFLAALRYQGVLYYGPALRVGALPPGEYRIPVYAARSVADSVPVELERRRLVARPLPGGIEVTDVATLRHEADWTRVGPDGDAVTWTLHLPTGAGDPEALAGSAFRTDITFRGGVALVRGPITPDAGPVAVRYRLPAGERASLALERPVGELELLARDNVSVVVAGLQPGDPASIQGEAYRRWVGTGLEPGVSVSFAVRGVPADPGTPPVAPWVFAGAGVLLLAAAAWAARRGRREGRT